MAGSSWREGAVRVYVKGKMADELRSLVKRAEALLDFSHFVALDKKSESQLAQYALTLGMKELKRKIEESESSG